MRQRMILSTFADILIIETEVRAWLKLFKGILVFMEQVNVKMYMSINKQQGNKILQFINELNYLNKEQCFIK